MEVPANLQLKSSNVDGLGIFALQDISANTVLGEWIGVKIKNKKEFESIWGKDYRYTYYSRFPWNPIYHCKEQRNFISYINHSETPNVYLKRKHLFAMTDITKDTELFLKYRSGQYDTKSFK
jgi:SET domain-containing protein